MIKKSPSRRPTKEANPYADFHCRDCTHSYDWNNKALDGHLILCRCPHDEKSKHGKFCKFLFDTACIQFKSRQ